MEKVYLSLGSNLEDRLLHLTSAITQIKELSVGKIKVSSIYSSEAVGYFSENDYYNLVVKIFTDLDPKDLLQKINQIEEKEGRVRNGDLSDRTLDIDIIFYGDHVINDSKLVIPHPRMQNRNFVLLPLLELDPDLVHPVLGKSIVELYAENTDPSEVVLIEEHINLT